MRPLFALVLGLLLASLATGCGRSYSHATPEELGESVFQSLQADDRAALDRFLPTQDDMLALLEKLQIPGDKKKQVLELVTQDWARIQEEMVSATDVSWESVRSEMGDAGVVLADCSLQGVEAKTKEKNGVAEADIDVLLNYGDEVYRIRIKNAGQVTRGWLLSKDGFDWKGKVDGETPFIYNLF